MKKLAARAFCVMAFCAAPWLAANSAESYPARPVHIVDGFPAGGSTDMLARYVGSQLTGIWGQSVVVENRAGASGQIGAGYVAKSVPNGYTLFVAPNPDILVVAPLLYKTLPYDVDKDFTPVAMLATVPLVMTVNQSITAKNVKEFIEQTKVKPGEITYGSAGQGTVHHLTAAKFASMAGIDMMHVPYKGTAPAVQDLLGGQINVVFSPISAVLPHIKSGKLRALAVAGTKRVAALPDVPTVAESGLPGYESNLWVSLIAPAGTPPEVINKLNTDVSKIMSTDDVKKLLAVQGIEPAIDTVDGIKKRLQSDTASWKKVIADANISID